MKILETNLGKLGEKLQSQQITLEQYKGLIMKFLAMDKKSVDIFEELKILNGITFVQNRMSIFVKEIKEINEML